MPLIAVVELCVIAAYTFCLRVISDITHSKNYTSVKIIKNEVGCRDDTVPKTVETRRHCEED